MNRLWATVMQEQNSVEAEYPEKNPYKRIGKVIYHKKGGKWRKKQEAESVENAKKAMRLLHGIERGWKPTGKKSRKRRKK